MLYRIYRTVDAGCDGINPNNVDGYENLNGFGLEQSDAMDFVDDRLEVSIGYYNISHGTQIEPIFPLG